MSLLRLHCAAVLFLYSVSVCGQTITTVAGGAVNDGGPVANGVVNNPTAVRTDIAGNAWIADAFHFRIRKVDTAGTITTVGGNGISVHGGDGGPATSASFSYVRDIAIDAAGGILLADVTNSRVRRISPAGTITTIAGTGVSGTGGDGGPATAAQLSVPRGLAIDAFGKIFIATNFGIRQISTGGIISTFLAGNSPHRLAMDGAGNVIASSYLNQIFQISPAGVATLIAGTGAAGSSGDGGPALNAQLNEPAGIAVAPDGTIYFADTLNGRVRSISPGGTINTISASFQSPTDVSILGADLLVTDRRNVWRLTLGGSVTAYTSMGGNSGDGGAATAAALGYIWDLAIGSGGDLDFADSVGARVRGVTSGGTISTFAGTGVAGPSSGDGGPATAAQVVPQCVTFDGRTGETYICDLYSIRRVSLLGIISTVAGTGVSGFSGDGGPATSARLMFPTSIDFDSAGNMYIADAGNNRIRRVATTGVITTIGGNGVAGYSGDGGPATAAAFWNPTSIVADGSGNLLIADVYNNRVRAINLTSGVVNTIAGTGAGGFSGDGGPAFTAQLSWPSGLAIDGAGALFIADELNHRIRKVDPSGNIISTVAGGTVQGFVGDGGAPLSARLNSPQELIIDNYSGAIYIADAGNKRVRKVTGVAAPCPYNLVPASNNVASGAGSGSLAVSTGSLCLWRAVSSDSWLSITSIPSGVGNGTVAYAVAANSGPSRSATITVGGLPFTLNQAAAFGCSYSIAPGSFSAAGSGGTGSIAVTTAGGCTWTAVANVPWIAITQGFSGVGSSASTTFDIALNTGAARSGTITIAGQTFTVNQAAAPACTYALTSNSFSAPGAGSTSSFSVLAAPNCGWTASSNGAWLGITSVSSSAGLGSVYFTVSQNPTSTARSAAITVNGQTFTVNQNASTGPVYTASVYAGGYPSGDGGPATSAALAFPYGIAVDASGNVLINDLQDRRIRRITPGGVISGFAGDGSRDYSGENVPATSAGMYAYGMTFDSAGNLYFADESNRIRRITPAGTILTIAGTGQGGYSGDGGPAWQAQLNRPRFVVADSQGSIYFSDSSNNRIRRISAAGIITTVAGTGVPGFSGDGGPATAAQIQFPHGITIDSAGNIYFADTNNFRIRRIDTAGIITTVLGTGATGYNGEGVPAISAQTDTIRGIKAVGSLIYFASDYGQRVRSFTPGGTVSTFAGDGVYGFSGDGGPATAASLRQPHDIAVDASGTFYIADESNHRIRRVTASNTISTFAGVDPLQGSGGQAASARLSDPRSLSLDAAGNLLIAEQNSSRIAFVDNTSGVLTTIAGTGTWGGFTPPAPALTSSLNFPNAVCAGLGADVFLGNGDLFKVAGGTITRYAGNGTPGDSGDGGPATSAQLRGVVGCVADNAGNLYVADFASSRVRKIATNGIITTYAGTGVAGYSGDGGPATAANIESPVGLGIDGAGNLLITAISGRIRQVSSTGTISTAAAAAAAPGFSGDGGPAVAAQLRYPYSLAFDSGGNAFVADRQNHVVRRISSAGTISTIYGTGSSGRASGQLSYPSGIAVTPSGTVYVSDLSQRVLALSSTSCSFTLAPTTQTFGASSAAGSFSLITQPGCPWTVSSSTPWVTVTSALNGFGSTTVNFDILANSGALRSGTIIAGGQTFNITQGSGLAPCTFSLTPPSLTTGSSSTVGGFTVNTGAGCAWTAIANDPWITFTTAATGVGPGAIGFAVQANVGGGSRSGSITVAGQTFLITQSAAVSAQPIPSVPSVFLPASTGLTPTSQSVLIGTNVPNTPFTAQSSAPVAGWLSVSPASGLLPATISITANPAGLSAGTYIGSVTITVPGGGTAIVPVVMSVAQTPTVVIGSAPVVITAAPGAANQVSGVVPAVATSPGVKFTANISGIPNMSVEPSSGVLPAALRLVPTGSIAPGTYSGTLTIETPAAIPAKSVVPITFSVPNPLPPQIEVQGGSLAFSASTSRPAESRQVIVSNLGSGTVSYTASVEQSAGRPWLRVSPLQGVTSVDGAVALNLDTNFAGLPAGVYRGTIIVESAQTGKRVEVPLRVAAGAPSDGIALSGAGVLFEASQNVSPAVQRFQVVNEGSATRRFTVTVRNISSTQNWLQASPVSGVLSPGNTFETVELRANTQGLAPGAYYSLVEVTSPDPGTLPQFLTAVLNVLPPSITPLPTVSPAGAVFVYDGLRNPNSQSIAISNPSNRPVTILSAAYVEGGVRNWLQVSPDSLRLSPGQSGDIRIQPVVSGIGTPPLAPGVYRGEVVVGFVEDRTARRVEVLLVIPPGAGTAAASSLKEPPRREATVCTASRLLPTFTLLGNDFNSTVNWPSPVEVTVVDDCGRPQTTGSVAVSFSNNDPLLYLTPLRNGRWAGTWQARTARSAVTLVASAILTLESGRLEGTTRISGRVSTQAQADPPVVRPGGVISAASRFTPTTHAPGAAILVLGSRLSSAERQAETAPLPRSLGDTEVSIGGRLLPLESTSDGQIKAVLPYGLVANTTYLMLVRRGASISVPEPVILAAATPAIYSADNSGSGQGAIYVVGGGQESLADARNPAVSGSTVRLFCTGLGVVAPDLEDGAAGPETGKPAAIEPVVLTVAGLEAAIQSTSLVPGLFGIHEVIATLPDNLPAGMAIRVILKTGTAESEPVTIAVR